MNTWQGRFEAIDINVAAITYDNREVLYEFASGMRLGYPLLSDPDGEYMSALGIRNEEYPPGSRGFGIPHPGIMLIDASRTILYKAAVEDYRARPPFDALFLAVSALVAETEIEPKAQSELPKSCTRRRAARSSACEKASL